MACQEDVGGERRCAVAIVDEEIPQAGWQELDLGRTFAGLPGPPETFARPGRAGGPPPIGSHGLRAGASAVFDALLTGRVGRRVPAAAFVAIGAPTRRAAGPALAAAGPARRIANDNRASGDGRSVWRDLFFLAILAATVAGAFWSGRVQGYQRVIVVPGPSSSTPS